MRGTRYMRLISWTLRGGSEHCRRDLLHATPKCKDIYIHCTSILDKIYNCILLPLNPDNKCPNARYEPDCQRKCVRKNSLSHKSNAYVGKTWARKPTRHCSADRQHRLNGRKPACRVSNIWVKWKIQWSMNKDTVKEFVDLFECKETCTSASEG